jgi:hypothetical protein
MDLTDICINSHKTHILLSSPQNFLKIDYILGHKASLNKDNKTEIISYVLLGYNRKKLEIKTNYKNIRTIWNLNNSFLKDQWVIKDSHIIT